jgi:Tfp pilus assembly protein FimT
MPHRPRRRAASLIDLMVMLLLIGIIASVATMKYFEALSYHSAQLTAERIAADLETARHTARSRSQTVTIAFDTTNSRYTVTGIANPDHPAAAYTVDLAIGNMKARLTTAAFGGDKTIIFNAFGMPDSGGSVTVASGKVSRTVNVTAHSGAVGVQ